MRMKYSDYNKKSKFKSFNIYTITKQLKKDWTTKIS